MATEKRALMAVFKPDKSKTTEEMRALFKASYSKFADMDAVESKCWWCDPENGEWGALYVFESEEAVKAYVSSETWQKIIPEKYGCTPAWRIVEVGLLLSKRVITEAEDSWLR